MRSLVLALPARIWGALVALALVCGVATPSGAEQFIRAGSTLELQVNVLDPIGLSLGAPVAATESRDNESLLTMVGFPEGIWGTEGVVVPVTDPLAFPIAGLLATLSNGTANFVRSEFGNIGGIMPLNGVVKVCLFGTCSQPPAANLSVPVSVLGQGGNAVVTGAVNLTVIGAPWTQATAAVGTVTIKGNADAETTQFPTGDTYSNVISLVTPVFVSTNIGASAVVPVFGRLNFSVPEPGSLAALGAAICSLVAVGFARRRSS